jgi:hypothetical protein
MLTLSFRHQLTIGLILAGLLAATRGNHVATISQLPSASWAVFFLAGVYLRPAWVYPALFAEAAALDTLAVLTGKAGAAHLGLTMVSLFIGYAVLWLAGQWYARRHRFRPQTLLPLAGSALVGAFVCKIFTSGGFYFFSGETADPTIAAFAVRFAKSFPGNLETLAMYVGVALLLHVTLTVALQTARARAAAAG